MASERENGGFNVQGDREGSHGEIHRAAILNGNPPSPLESLISSLPLSLKLKRSNQPVSKPTFPLQGENQPFENYSPDRKALKPKLSSPSSTPSKSAGNWKHHRKILLDHDTIMPDPLLDSPNHGGTLPILVYLVNFKFKPEDDDLPDKMRLLESKLLFIKGHLGSDDRYDGQNKIYRENETERLKGSYEATIKFAYEVETSMLSWNSTMSQGSPLTLKPCILAFPRFLPVVEYLMMNITGFESLDYVKKFRMEVKESLTGLKVRVNHHTTNDEYTIAGLTDEDAHEITFDCEGEKVDLVSHFLNSWNKVVEHINTPCLELGTIDKPNKVPMEFCELVKEKYRIEESDIGIWNWGRRRATYQIVQAELGPYNQGNIERHFGNKDVMMTKVTGWVLNAPPLVLHDHIPITMNLDDCHWSLYKKTLMDARSLKRCALIDFSTFT